MATIVNLTNQAGADLVLYATWQPRVYDVSFVSSNNNQGTVTYTARQIAMNGRRPDARACDAGQQLHLTRCASGPTR